MTTTPSDRLYDALRPGSRRCTEPCPDCKSSSVLNSRTQTYVPHSGDDEPCPTCDGHGFAFRTDAEGLLLIGDACEYWFHKLSRADQREHFTIPTPDDGEEHWESRYIRLGIWNRRAGQPWRESLEQHVRDYEAPAPDLLANDGAELKRLLREVGNSYSIWYSPLSGLFKASVADPGNVMRDIGGGEADTEAAALIAATEAALGLGENDDA